MTFLVIVFISALMLQSYLFICGCSTAPERGSSTDQSDQLLYSAKCGSCHYLISPQEHDIETWVHYVHKYGKQMTDEEKQQVIDYLESKAAGIGTGTRPSKNTQM